MNISDKNKLHPTVTIKLLDLVESYEKYHRQERDPKLYGELKKLLANYREV